MHSAVSLSQKTFMPRSWSQPEQPGRDRGDIHSARARNNSDRLNRRGSSELITLLAIRLQSVSKCSVSRRRTRENCILP